MSLKLDPVNQLPKDVNLMIFSYLSPEELGRCGRVCKKWQVLANTDALWRALHPAITFGKKKWEAYVGDIGEEPLLPRVVYKILKSPCPFWQGKKVEETHLLTLIPKTVNGKPLTLKSLGELVQHPRQKEATKYAYLDLGQYTDPPAPSSHWVLMSKDVLPGSRSKSYAELQALVHSYRQKAPYEVPSILDAAVCIFMEYFRSGTYLYGQSPWTFTRCQEKYNADWQLVVGGFAAGGLHVIVSDGDDSEYYGVGGLRKF